MMQFTPTPSVDLLSPGRPVSPAAGTSGQDGAFADHLVAAVQGQGPGARSPVTVPNQENNPSQAVATTLPDAAIPTVPTSSSDVASTPPLSDPVAVSSEDTIQDGSGDDPTMGAALNSSAGALNAAMPIQWAGLDQGRLIDQDLSPSGARSSSIVDRMLTAITVAGQLPVTATIGGQTAPLNPISSPADAKTSLAEQLAASVGFSPRTEGDQRNVAVETASPTDGAMAVTGEPRQNLEATIWHNIPAQEFGSEAALATPAAAIDLNVDKGQATPPAQTLATETPGTATNTATTIGQNVDKGQATPPAQTLATETPDITTTTTTIDQNVDKGQTTPPAQTLATETPGIATTITSIDLNQAGDKSQALASEAANPTTTPPAERVARKPAGDQIVQNQYGQILTIHQTGDPEETADQAIVTGKTSPPLAAGGQVQDINSNYIRSHLPNEGPKTVTNEPSAQQQQTDKDNQPKGTNLAVPLIEESGPTDETGRQRPQFTLGSENQPLVFSSQSTKSAGANNTSATDALSLRLPSGLNVATGTVVDQMATHFANTRPLESGTVNLRLHPQELGELRMEIKVEQDNIKAHIIAQTPQAQEMIDRHLPRLREALAQQGLHLQQIEVTVAGGDQSGGQRFQDNSRQQLGQSLHKGTGQSLFTLDPDEETPESTSSVNNLSVLA